MATAIDPVEIATKDPVPAVLVPEPAVTVPPSPVTSPSVGSSTIGPHPVIPSTIGAHPRKKWAKWAVAAGLALVVGVGVEVWRTHAQNAISYDTVAVDRGLIQANVTATGTLNAVVDVQVGSQVSGNIKALYANWNTKVTKGQLVALIDPQVFQAQVDQAQAALGSAHSAVLAAQALVQKSKADLSGTNASEKSAESVAAKDRANLANAKGQSERADELFAAQVSSRQDHEIATAAYGAAQAQVTADEAQIDAAKQTILAAQAQVLVVQSQLGSAQAQERQAQGALEQAKINLEHTKITAPVDGTVIARRMDVGQTVAASFAAPTIFEIAQDLTKMQLDTNVDESDIGNISAGQATTFTVDAYPTTTFHGLVNDVRKAPINASNVVTYDVVIGVSNPDLKLFPGMTANAKIYTAKLDDTLRVPNAVLRLHPSAAVLKQAGLPPAQTGKQEIYVLRSGKLTTVAVTFGLSDGRYTAVTSGDVKAGDTVVVRFTTGAAAPSSATPAAPGATQQRGPRI
jgi:HlyD family secretion protein